MSLRNDQYKADPQNFKDYEVENLYHRFLQIADMAIILKKRWEAIVIGNYKECIVENNKCKNVYYSQQDKNEAKELFDVEVHRIIKKHPEMQDIIEAQLKHN